MLSRQPLGTVLATPECRALMEGLLQEVIDVAQATEVSLSPELPGQLMDLISSRLPPTHRTSTFTDLIDGKRMELEALNGTVVRLGREHGVDVPLNFAVYAALKPYIDGPPASPWDLQNAEAVQA